MPLRFRDLQREYPLWSTIRNNTRWSIRVTPNKPIAIVYGDINDSTLHCRNSFRRRYSFKPNSAFLAVQLSSKDHTQPGGGKHFCALGRKRACGGTHPWVRGKQ